MDLIDRVALNTDLGGPCDEITEVNVKSVPGDLDGLGGENGVKKSERDEDDLSMALKALEDTGLPLKVRITGPGVWPPLP